MVGWRPGRGPGLAKRIPVALLAAWAEAIRDPLGRHLQPLKLSRGTLHVAVDSDEWLHAAEELAPQILARLAEAGLPRPVRRLRFLLRPGEVEDLDGVETPERPSLPRLEQSTAAEIDALTAPIEDHALRERLRTYLELHARLQQARGREEDQGGT
jgi:hypothetical protein